MKLSEIQDAWVKDAQVNPDELGQEAIKTLNLHAKYITWLVEERLVLKKLKYDLEELKKEKWEFYVYGPTLEQHKKGWELPPQGKILKSEVKMYIDSDPDITKISMRIDIQSEKVELLNAIVETINRRGFQIKTAVEWERFKQGLN